MMNFESLAGIEIITVFLSNPVISLLQKCSDFCTKIAYAEVVLTHLFWLYEPLLRVSPALPLPTGQQPVQDSSCNISGSSSLFVTIVQYLQSE